MYNRKQAFVLKQSFWTAFGRYMAPVPAADGTKINWINYKTGVKHLYFRMDVTSSRATIGIVLTNPDRNGQQQDYQKLIPMKTVLEEAVGELWQWEQGISDEHGKAISVIGTVMENVNVFSEDNWPRIISFLKPRIIALDAFWWLAKDLFQ